jgi:hypothetical protein
VSQPSEIEARLAAVEARVEEAVADAAAARHLAAARDRDLADVAVKIDANRKAINALGIQTAARFDRLEARVERGFAEMDEKMDRGFSETDRGFTEMRGRLDGTAAWMQRIVDLLERRDGS